MSPIELVLIVMYWTNLLLSLAVAITCVWAFVQAGMSVESAYRFYTKRTKGFWVALTGGAALAAVLMLVATFLGYAGITGSMMLMELIAITISMVFLSGVYPSVRRRM